MATSLERDRGPATGFLGRASATLHRRPGIRLAGLLLPSLGWMLVVYVGSLLLLFVSSFWRLDPFTGLVVHDWGLGNFRKIVTESVYLVTAARTLGIAVAVTATDIALALPIAYYAARVASPRGRAAILLAVVLPLWSSYLVRVFAWRVILSSHGLLSWLFLNQLHVGFSMWALWITFVYLWLPFVILPIYAALERVPPSLIEASGDLGARGWTTFREVVWPLAIPGIVAGSIFSFSLTLGDYIAPTLVSNTQFIGNIVYQQTGVAGNYPFAAAYALVPVILVGLYLLLARRLGAFEAL
jgi:putative spermidine/putrescine transport system permease protein